MRVRAIVGGQRLDALTRGVADHTPQQCDGTTCPLHARSEHHMLAWPQWHGRRVNLTVRECPHGALHPDPDDVRWARRDLAAHADECDGCCAAPRGIRTPGERVRIGVHDFGLLVAGVVDHSARHCDGDGACPRHDPTAHHMRDWPQWHGDTIRLTMRECPHGLLHPDPDDRRWHDGGHRCDGCCAPP